MTTILTRTIYAGAKTVGALYQERGGPVRLVTQDLTLLNRFRREPIIRRFEVQERAERVYHEERIPSDHSEALTCVRESLSPEMDYQFSPLEPSDSIPDNAVSKGTFSGLFLRKQQEFEETAHPRGPGGQFASKPIQDEEAEWAAAAEEARAATERAFPRGAPNNVMRWNPPLQTQAEDDVWPTEEIEGDPLPVDGPEPYKAEARQAESDFQVLSDVWSRHGTGITRGVQDGVSYEILGCGANQESIRLIHDTVAGVISKAEPGVRDILQSTGGIRVVACSDDAWAEFYAGDNPQTAGGTYKTYSGLIGVKSGSTGKTVRHEIGHQIDFTVGRLSKYGYAALSESEEFEDLYRAARKMEDYSSYATTSPTEGFAEVVGFEGKTYAARSRAIRSPSAPPLPPPGPQEDLSGLLSHLPRAKGTWNDRMRSYRTQIVSECGVRARSLKAGGVK